MTIAATARLNSAFDNVASSAPHFLTLSAYRDEDPGYHKQGSGPAHTVFATALSQANTIKASPQSGVVDQGKANMVIGRDPGGALSVRQLSVQSVASRPLQHPTLLNSWRQFSVTNRSTIGFWVSGSSRLRFVARELTTVILRQMDMLHCVHLQGHLSSGVLHTPMFTLPVEMRPMKNKTFAVAGAAVSRSCISSIYY